MAFSFGDATALVIDVMDLVSSALPASPMISAPLLVNAPSLQAPTLPGNFWTLLFAPSPDLEVVVEEPSGAPDTIKVASPQEIATALIRSMLTPVAQPSVHDAEEMPAQENADEKNEEPNPTVLAVTPAVVPLEIPAPMVSAEQPVVRREIPTKPGSTRAPSLPSMVPINKTSPEPRVAFELRLTPMVDEATASPIQTAAKTDSPAVPTNRGETTPLETLNPPQEIQTTQEQFHESDPSETPAQAKQADAREPFRIKRSGATTFKRESPDSPSPQFPVPTGKPHTAADVPFVVASPETTGGFQPKMPVHEGLGEFTPSTFTPYDQSAKPEPASTPVQEIAMRVSAPDAQPVDVRVSERGGEVRVSVRTADTGLRTSLQGDLGSLVGKLEQSGFHTEASIPDGSVPALSTDSTADLSGSGTDGESQDTQAESQGRWTGSESRQPDQHQQQQHRRLARAWEEMMEDTQ